MAQSQPSAARDQVRNIVPGLIDLSERVLFGEVWERPGLSKRDRSLITCATLIALGREKQLVGHLQRALDNGLTQKRAQRSDHPSRLLRRLAGGDDRGAGRQGRVREEIGQPGEACVCGKSRFSITPGLSRGSLDCRVEPGNDDLRSQAVADCGRAR